MKYHYPLQFFPLSTAIHHSNLSLNDADDCLPSIPIYKLQKWLCFCFLNRAAILQLIGIYLIFKVVKCFL